MITKEQINAQLDALAKQELECRYRLEAIHGARQLCYGFLKQIAQQEQAAQADAEKQAGLLTA